MTEELTARNTEPFVICRDVRKSFGSNEVLRGISLEVKKGDPRSLGVRQVNTPSVYQSSGNNGFRNDHGRR